MIQTKTKLLHTTLLSSFITVAASFSLHSDLAYAVTDSASVEQGTPTAGLSLGGQHTALENAAIADALEQINQYNQQKQYQQSLTLVQQLLSQHPESPDLALMEGVLFSEIGRIDEAEQVFLSLSQKHPELPEPLNNLAVIYVNRGDLNRAISTLQKAFETHPSYARVQSNLRTLYTTLASQAYNRALNLGSQAPAPVLAALDRIPEPARPLIGHGGGERITPQPQALLASATSEHSASLTAQEKADVQADIIRAAQQTKPVSSENTQATATNTSQISAVETDTPNLVTASDDQPAQAIKDKQPTADTAKPVIAVAPQSTAEQDAEAQRQAAALKAQAEQKAAEEAALRDALKMQVRDWAAAWSAQDVPAYLAFYTADFRPANRLSNKRWKQQRQQRLTKPKSISVDVSGMTVQIKSPTIVNVNFTQRYRADNYRDKVIKTLRFEKQDGKWLINTELSRKLR